MQIKFQEEKNHARVVIAMNEKVVITDGIDNKIENFLIRKNKTIISNEERLKTTTSSSSPVMKVSLANEMLIERGKCSRKNIFKSTRACIPLIQFVVGQGECD